jgi:hypothetical protein
MVQGEIDNYSSRAPVFSSKYGLGHFTLYGQLEKAGVDF